MNIKFMHQKNITASDTLNNLLLFAPICELCESKDYKFIYNIDHLHYHHLMICNSCSNFARILSEPFANLDFFETSKIYFDKNEKMCFHFTFGRDQKSNYFFVKNNMDHIHYGAYDYILPVNIGKLVISDIKNFSSIIQNYLLLQ